ncbi:aminotransferase class V-fold PLP-dependent enzyme [Jiangella rhizosphaerae]|uniref:Aminotransferase class V-fold PLP-dependent enzyme n=1 Tax=Jiangella rhizosphaerae TaxID=2293569 RepID=A0A418KLW0_9ACTN|nr:aminotransferase class V-fold PLP-dependent enzyme [Jiangella rhizosphaerae]RIQ18918.1 aminotransferase class V-fold PLP-dependent enzyme [Jiangella rhizosphaerae]
MDLAAARSLFDPDPGWLNTASYGLPPSTAWTALQEALDEWRHGRVSWEGWGASTARARAAFARLVQADEHDVTTGAQVSQLVGLLAASVPDGTVVLAPEEDFTSLLFPWLAQAHRGVEVRTVPAAQLADRVTPDVDVVAFSVVQSASGMIADLDGVLAAARAAGAITVADATQAVGWLPVDARRFDAMVAGGYKWQLSPRGTAFLVTTADLRERVVPSQAGWWAGDDPHASYYGPPLRLAADARRLDLSPAWFSWVGAAPALELLEAVTVEAVHDWNVGLANRFRAGLGLPPGDSAIVSVDVPGAQERLAAAGVRAAVRGGRLRVSFHLYSSEADADLAVAALTS